MRRCNILALTVNKRALPVNTVTEEYLQAPVVLQKKCQPPQKNNKNDGIIEQCRPNRLQIQSMLACMPAEYIT